MNKRFIQLIFISGVVLLAAYALYLQHKKTQLDQQFQSMKKRMVDIEKKLGAVKHLDEQLRTLTDLSPSTPHEAAATSLFDESWNDSITKSHLDGLQEEIDHQLLSLSNLVDYFGEQKLRLETTPSIWPSLGWVTSHFGPRLDPFTGNPAMHTGLDIAARYASKVVATAAGYVLFSGDGGALGNLVSIDHGSGLVTQYAHLAKSLVKVGDRVKRGDTIALIGSSGRSTGAHLHYEVRQNGIAVNPRPYIVD